MVGTVVHINWQPSWRIIPTRHPPINFFERVSDPNDWEALLELESMTDDSARQLKDKIHILPAEDRISGPGAGRILPSFIFLSRDGGRFNDSTFGAYYAANNLETAIAETIFHREQFMAATKEKPQVLENVVLVADVDCDVQDIRGLQASNPELYDPDDYSKSQSFAKKLRDSGVAGVVFHSVRNPGGECIAIFQARQIKNCREERIIIYEWDGARISAHYIKTSHTNSFPKLKEVKEKLLKAQIDLGDAFDAVLQYGRTALTLEERTWIESEINGYIVSEVTPKDVPDENPDLIPAGMSFDGLELLPDYRQLRANKTVSKSTITGVERDATDTAFGRMPHLEIRPVRILETDLYPKLANGQTLGTLSQLLWFENTKYIPTAEFRRLFGGMKTSLVRLIDSLLARMSA